MIAGAAIYLTGIYTEDTHKMHFVGLLVSGQGTPKAIHKIISGNETECRVNAMGILLNFVKDRTLPILCTQTSMTLFVGGMEHKRLFPNEQKIF